MANFGPNQGKYSASQRPSRSQAEHFGGMPRAVEPTRLVPMFMDPVCNPQFEHPTAATTYLHRHPGQIPPHLRATITPADIPRTDDEMIIIHNIQVPSNAPPRPPFFPINSARPSVPSSKNHSRELGSRAYSSIPQTTEDPIISHNVQVPSNAPPLPSAPHDSTDARRPQPSSHSPSRSTGPNLMRSPHELASAYSTTRRVEEPPMIAPPSPSLTEPQPNDRAHSEQLQAFSFGPAKRAYSERPPSPMAAAYLSYPTPFSPGYYPASPLTVYNGMSPSPRHLSPPAISVQPSSHTEGLTYGRGDTTGTGRRVSVSRPVPYHRRQSSGQGIPDGTPSQRRQSVSENAPIKRAAALSSVRVSRKPHGMDWSKCRPGQRHIIVSNSAHCKFAPHATVRDFEELGLKAEVVTYAPRRAEYSSPDHTRTINFSVRGMPGPSISSILKETVELDGHSDKVFEEMKWRSTKLFFDWPGIDSRNEGIEANCTRGELALLVAKMIARDTTLLSSGRKVQEPVKDAKEWNLRLLRPKYLRLISLNYYKNVWVPVLAYDYDI